MWHMHDRVSAKFVFTCVLYIDVHAIDSVGLCCVVCDMICFFSCCVFLFCSICRIYSFRLSIV